MENVKVLQSNNYVMLSIQRVCGDIHVETFTEAFSSCGFAFTMIYLSFASDMISFDPTLPRQICERSYSTEGFFRVARRLLRTSQ
jgi:hypothetical protein